MMPRLTRIASSAVGGARSTSSAVGIGTGTPSQ
jgi:hypothetical protein